MVVYRQCDRAHDGGGGRCGCAGGGGGVSSRIVLVFAFE